MSIIIDRRLNGKNRSTVNRQRFIRRYRKNIKHSISDAVNKRSITDVDSGSEVSISQKDLSEPIFRHGDGGSYQTVHPGNKEFLQGDQIAKPSNGQGATSSSNGDASSSGQGIEEFIFQISHDEFIDMMFDNLALPNMVLKQRKENMEVKKRLGGLVSEGPPNRLNVIRSLKSAYTRRIGISCNTRKKLRSLKEELEVLQIENKDSEKIEEVEEKILLLESSLAKLPFIDEMDLRFNHIISEPQPSNQAVMLCLMDVSGSMTQDIKAMAKRFFILLYLFLQRNYSAVKVVFVRHHTTAKEVDEQDFFYSRETGGTIVSSALILAKNLIKNEYPANEWNVYVAQVSDGDNWEGDSALCKKVLLEGILPYVQYYSYVEITDRQHQNLWQEYEAIQKQYPELFAMETMKEYADIYPLFCKLFKKKEIA